MDRLRRKFSLEDYDQRPPAGKPNKTSMCLFSVKPKYDVEFESRAPRRKVVAYIPERRSERISETIIRDRPAQYVQAPRASTPVIRPVTPPRSIRASSPARIELVSVEETRSSPRTSRVSVTGGKGKSRGGRDEVYIERTRDTVLRVPEPDYDTYRYVEAPGKPQLYLEEGRRRSRSITYETNPRLSGRLVERERVVVENDGRRREYYRKA